MTLRAIVLCLVAAPLLVGVEIDEGSRELRRQIAETERAIDRGFQSLDDAAPMAIVGATRGAYLEGYGAVFTVQINLAPVANLSPFRRSYSEEEKRQLNVRKRQRLETLESRLREIMVRETRRLTRLPADEVVAVAVSLFHFAWEDLTQLPSQMVMAAARSVLDQARDGKFPAADLRQRLAVSLF